MDKKAREAQAADPVGHTPTAKCDCPTCKRKLTRPAKLAAHDAVVKGWGDHAARPTPAQQRKLVKKVNESFADSGIDFIYTMRHLDNKIRTLMVAHQKQAAKSDASGATSLPPSYREGYKSNWVQQQRATHAEDSSAPLPASAAPGYGTMASRLAIEGAMGIAAARSFSAFCRGHQAGLLAPRHRIEFRHGPADFWRPSARPVACVRIYK